MKVVLLAGGFGTRLSEHTRTVPKPMIKVGGKPMLFHIMKLYAKYGYKDFYIALGYKGEVIKKFFSKKKFKWKINLINTGKNTMTGGRLKRVENSINGTFCMTYGDGVSDVNIKNLISFHKEKKSIATLTAIHPPERFGVLELSGDVVKEFHEKHRGDSSWINGGFFVLEKDIFNYLEGDDTILERKPFETLAKKGELTAFKHNKFWHPMDTLRDKKYLENLWNSKNAPWKTWQ